MVKTSATAMSKLIDDLLYYSKNVENNEGRMNLHIRSEVDDVIKLILIDNEVVVDKINLNHQIVFQPVAFKQIIQNLISNAIKYNDKEVTRITISYSDNDKTVTIKDNGPGIPIGQEEKVFDMFYTLGQSSRGDSSTGIGLNLVKKLAERNDATVHFKNNVEEGAEVVISNIILA